jgi:membrane carboxypeptidase/penicillin-binding protein
VRIGFDDNRSLGAGESGALAALPVFREIMLKVYQENLAGPAPHFPAEMEENIDAYLKGEIKPKDTSGLVNTLGVAKAYDDAIEDCSSRPGLSAFRCAPSGDQRYPIYPSKNERGGLTFRNE